MTLGVGSIRGRLIVLSLVLMLFLVGAAFYIQRLVDQSVEASSQATSERRSYAANLTSLKGHLYRIESSLYQYAVLMDESQRLAMMAVMEQVQQEKSLLLSSPLSGSDAEAGALTLRLSALLDALDSEIRQLLALMDNIDTRYPATPIIGTQLHPAFLRFLAIIDVLGEEWRSDPGATDFADILHTIRYTWTQQAAVFRMYIANRSGVFGSPPEQMAQQLKNRDIYWQQLKASLSQLAQFDSEGQLDFTQSAAVEEMNSILAEFEAAMEQVIDLYESERWRTDIPFFREHLQPSFQTTWQTVQTIEKRLEAISSENIAQSAGAASSISHFIWLVSGLAGLFLLFTYVSYEYLIRRPLTQLTNALEALGDGVAYTPLLTSHTAETVQMLRAFRDMQNQVQARETRLTAILDNASEGIITINKGGIIETFNNAAELLFGYELDEVLGRNVTILMPHPTRDEHDQYLENYLKTGECRVLGSEMNVVARRKDGSLFPMSIKLSVLNLDGQTYFTAIVSDISERKAMMDHLRQLAEHDSLTGLYNRQYFSEELERVVERARRQGGLDSALLYIDLDNFKFVNDTLGHMAGDRVLVEVAGIISKRSRRGDVTARLGGDEFAVLLFDVDLEQARLAAEDYRQMLADYGFRHLGRMIDIGCSIGLAMLGPDVANKEELMSRADLSCHMAKRAGRNSVHVYRSDDRQSVEDMSADMGWTRTIKAAIDANSFDFALQPIMDLSREETTHYEVLLRMLGDDDEIIMPSGFLPSAERFGLILDIDRWVIAHAIDLLSMYPNPEVRFTINLSGMSVGDPGVLHHITGLLAAYQMDPTRLIFEITETVAIADLEAAIETLEQLRALGCKTALDDFGAGYSSFAYLKDLPVDYVKIDGSFVRRAAEDTLHRAMVKSMNEIAHAMGKLTVAEYVCDAQILGVMRELGVDYVQGYHVGEPQLVGYPRLMAEEDELRTTGS